VRFGTVRSKSLKRPLRTWLAGQFGGLAAAFRFLTCLPLPAPKTSVEDDLSRALPYFPLVGLAIGGLLVALDQALAPWFARPLVDLALLAALVLVSGALHLDGLVDTADGLFGPGPAERRLAAMRQSWAGPRGVAAALGQLLLLYAALAALPPGQRTPALVLAPVLGRWAVVYCYVAFPYARPGPSLSRVLKNGATPLVGLAATTFTLALAALVSWPGGPILLALGWLLVELAGRLARQRLGGMSGDVYGAVEQIVESMTLLLLPVISYPR
jgi:adenosylcobinamide-GDP ribazoletransferase